MSPHLISPERLQQTLLFSITLFTQRQTLHSSSLHAGHKLTHAKGVHKRPSGSTQIRGAAVHHKGHHSSTHDPTSDTVFHRVMNCISVHLPHVAFAAPTQQMDQIFSCPSMDPAHTTTPQSKPHRIPETAGPVLKSLCQR